VVVRREDQLTVLINGNIGWVGARNQVFIQFLKRLFSSIKNL